MKKDSAFLYYLNVTAPFYYFYIVPLFIILLAVNLNLPFDGIFPTTVAANISSQHKMINDFFAICTFCTITLILINYVRYRLRSDDIKEIQRHHLSLNKNQQSISGWIGRLFFIFILTFINLNWFLIDAQPLRKYQDWEKGDSLTYLFYFAHPYLSAFIVSLVYALIIFLTLLFIYSLNQRKHRPI